MKSFEMQKEPKHSTNKFHWVTDNSSHLHTIQSSVNTEIAYKIGFKDESASKIVLNMVEINKCTCQQSFYDMTSKYKAKTKS